MTDFLAEGPRVAFSKLALCYFIWSLSLGFAILSAAGNRELLMNGVTMAIAFGALTIIAVASALLPAWRAASMTPVEALHNER